MKKHQIRVKKQLGQNFLIDRQVLADIIKTAELTPQDVVLEIGAGLGTLTEPLAERAKKIIALEKDPQLTGLLLSELGQLKNVSILNEDARTFIADNSVPFNKVVANLPFYLTSPLLTGMMGLSPSPSLMVLMVQREVAERICAQPPKANRMAVLCQLQASCRLVRHVATSCFWPAPEVQASVIKINIKSPPPDPLLLKLVCAGFRSPRKTLANNLSSYPGFSRNMLTCCNLSPKIRAEALSLQDWQRLKNCFLSQKNVIIKLR